MNKKTTKNLGLKTITEELIDFTASPSGASVSITPQNIPSYYDGWAYSRDNAFYKTSYDSNLVTEQFTAAGLKSIYVRGFRVIDGEEILADTFKKEDVTITVGIGSEFTYNPTTWGIFDPNGSMYGFRLNQDRWAYCNGGSCSDIISYFTSQPYHSNPGSIPNNSSYQRNVKAYYPGRSSAYHSSYDVLNSNTWMESYSGLSGVEFEFDSPIPISVWKMNPDGSKGVLFSDTQEVGYMSIERDDNGSGPYRLFFFKQSPSQGWINGPTQDSWDFYVNYPNHHPSLIIGFR